MKRKLTIDTTIVKPMIVILIAIFFWECKKEKDNEIYIDPSLLLNHEWTLTSIQDKNTNQIIVYPENITQKESILFTDSLTIIFSCACNHGWGKYRINYNRITFEDCYKTLMYCTNLQWEDYFLENLDKAYQFDIKANQLVIRSNGAYNLIFNY